MMNTKRIQELRAALDRAPHIPNRGEVEDALDELATCAAELSTLRAKLAEREQQIVFKDAEIGQLTRSRDYFQRESAATQVRLSEWMAPYDQAKADFLRRSCEALRKPGLSLPQVYFEVEQMRERLSTCEPVIDAVARLQRSRGGRDRQDVLDDLLVIPLPAKVNP